MRLSRCGLALLSGVLLATVASLAQEPPPPEGDTAQGGRTARLAERDRLAGQARRLDRGGKLAEAIEALEDALVIEREVFGDVHEEVVGTLQWIAELAEARGDFPMAESRLGNVLGVTTKLHGDGHWKVTDAKLALEGLRLRAELTPEQRRLLTRANTLVSKTRRLYRDGKTREAIAAAEEVAEIRRKVLGEEHPDYAASLNNVAFLYHSMREFAAAEPLYRQALEIKKGALGEAHPSFATGLNNLAGLYRSMGEYVRAEPLYRQALEIRRMALGEEHPDFAESLNNLADLYSSMGEYAKAESLCRQVLEIRKRVLGEEHPDYAASLNNLAALCSSMGERAAAELLYRQALEIKRKLLGDKHPSLALGLNNLARLYREMGEYAKAEPLYREALEIRRKTLGEEHLDTATSLSDLANLYESMGELAAAEPLLEQALEIVRKVLGEDHLAYATSLANLGGLYLMMKEYSKTEQLYERALEIRRQALGEDHASCAASLDNLAHLYLATGEPIKAEPLYREALRIKGAVYGVSHTYYAMGLHNLATLYVSTGEYEKAEPLYRQALAIDAKALGEEHPGYATALSSLALVYEFTGEFAAAEPLYRQALEIRRRVLDSTFAVQSERQQMQMTRMFRGTLGSFLSMSALAEGSVTDAYANVLAWKGAIFARQALARVPAKDPAVARLFSELESTGRRLATLSLSAPRPARQKTRQRQLRELTGKMEELERELSVKSEAFREARAAERLTPDELQGALPSGTLLIDLLEYERAVPSEESGPPGRRRERHVVAFLVPGQGEVRRVELGPVAPIREAIAAWRASLPAGDADETGKRLRELLWDPISKQLDGVKTLLISPDGALSRMPISALPGREPGTYMIEEIPVAVVPVPRMLPGLLSRTPSPGERQSLLLVGDVDYGGSPGEGVGPAVRRSAAGTSGGTLPRFRRLPATPSEVAAIRDTFQVRFEDGQVKLLCQADATEAAFRDGASNFRWLHLATHGFFAPPGLKSALADAGDGGQGETPVVGYHPGLLSGLALSGANTPPEPDADDGILTALEVASLDLSGVEVAVLSACETGLGEVAGGEGVLGLQRAFQVAGARTTVTSLWSVPDRATRLLMERFYANLWDRGMPRLEALREAQLWLLREASRPDSDVARGLRIEREPLKPSNGRLPPYYWAGWVLSGDWR